MAAPPIKKVFLSHTESAWDNGGISNIVHRDLH